MTRPTRGERKAQTRACLLEAAAEVFAARGFQAASVDQVAAAAGFTKGAVYAHFESKEELFLALLDERFSSRIDELRSILAEPESDPGEQARLAGSGYVARLDADPRWTPLFFEFWSHAVRNPALAGKLVGRYRALRSAIAELLDRRAGELDLEPVLPTEDVALMAFAMANGIALERALEPERVGPDVYGTMLQVFFRGLQAMAEDAAAAAAAPAEPRAPGAQPSSR